MTNGYAQVPGSFRDPGDYVYLGDSEFYRQVNQSYREEFDLLLESGLYQQLVDDGLLIHHTEVELEHAASDDAYEMIRPQRIPFISYPYEWSFSQLREAALLTLEIQSRAFDAGMSMKDCSAYNVQFVASRPVFVDTLYFERTRSDSQVQRLLSTREDIFPQYHEESFEAEFGKIFPIEHREPTQDTERTLYLMELRG